MLHSPFKVVVLAPDVREANQRDENQSQEMDRVYDLIHFNGFLLFQVSPSLSIFSRRERF